MKNDQDDGRITVSGDRPIRLMDADKHEFEKKGDEMVVEPAHKRAIVIEVARVKPNVP